MIGKRDVYIINVGMNSKHKGLLKNGNFPPLFHDNKFKFFPFPVNYDSGTTYHDLGLSKWIKNPNAYVHHDPEFKSNTFGDYIGNPRSSRLKEMKINDFLFFFASFQFKMQLGFYFIGFFQIESIHRLVIDKNVEMIKENAHYIDGIDIEATVWRGNKYSKLFERAVPFSYEIAYHILRDSEGKKLEFDYKNKKGKKQRNFHD